MKQVMNHNKDNGLLNLIRRTDTMISHALYLDMGRGWNYAWFRDEDGKVKEIFPESKLAPSYKYRTNWITFYK